jgi:3-hydroxybutyryl-CoA dehydrogenase
MSDDAIAAGLNAGYYADADDLARRGVGSRSDIDVAMRLGAGYREGPFEARGHTTVAHADHHTGAISGWDTVAILGTGQMASGIAEAIARSGKRVIVLGRTPASLDRARRTATAVIERAVTRGRLDRDAADAVAGRLSFTDDPTGIRSVDLAIEAVSEDLGVKHEVLSLAHAHCDREVVFATNTSSYRVSEVMSPIAAERAHLALHFFNPAGVMKLVEVVPGSDPSLVENGGVWADEVGKVPVVSADIRGFIVNRLLIPYLNDAVRLHERGVSVTDIDEAMRASGLPMGPFELIDLIGVDVTIAALESMSAESDGDRARPSGLLLTMAAAGRLGRKSGSGFYSESEK